jgi:hypothetical protein
MHKFLRLLLDPLPGAGGGGSPYSSGAGADEPGAVSNRLSLDPNDSRWSDTLGKWDDGETYTVTVTMRQMSPGEFEVTALKSAATPTDDESAETDDAADAAPAPAASSDNPAIANLD